MIWTSIGPNKFAGKCDGCWHPVEAERGVFEVVKAERGLKRVRCKGCVKDGRSGGAPDMPWRLHDMIGEAISDNPDDFRAFVDGRWTIALPYDQAELLARHKPKD